MQARGYFLIYRFNTLQSNCLALRSQYLLTINNCTKATSCRHYARKVDPNLPKFETGFSLFHKRPSRPFPPPFVSPPTSSFSEPLSTHDRSHLRRQSPESFTSGFLRGHTNGDDAILVHPRYLGVADGVGAWNTKEDGNAALWSRLIMHYFSIAVDQYYYKLSASSPSPSPFSAGYEKTNPPDLKRFLQEAYTATTRATTNAHGVSWSGTTTACCAVLTPDLTLHVINVGDSQLRVLRPRSHEFVLKTEEQWHWFDCPRQLGTNSPDTPELNGVVQSVQLEHDDIIILSSDGMPDNLYEHEVITVCMKTLGLSVPKDIDASEFVGELREKTGIEDVSVALREEEETTSTTTTTTPAHNDNQVTESGDDARVNTNTGSSIQEDRNDDDIMTRLASELVRAAKAVATDPYAESPWMERAVDEGLAAQGGKLDDISVVVARLKLKKQGII